VTDRPGFIAFRGSFHGRTFGAASVTSVKAKYRSHYEPFVPGVYFAEYPDSYRCPVGSGEQAALTWSIDSVQRLFDHFIPPSSVAAVLVEPVQGEGGYIVPPAAFLRRLREMCDQHGILLIFDEVQTGFGRTGEMFAAQVFDVRPDIMAVAKGIANGFPLSATVSSREIMSRWLAGSHGTTFGGNPVACAAALAVQEVIAEENLLENCRKMGDLLLDGLRDLQKKYPFIGDVRGTGLMTAIEIVIPDGSKTPDGEKAMQILTRALERGLVLYMAGRYGQVVRLIPPINIKKEIIEEALEILEVCMQEMV
jgi:4-aminobutyrate aminotransferase